MDMGQRSVAVGYGGVTMFVYEKQLQYPVKIKNTNPALAKLIITQYGGAYSKTL